MSKSRKENGKKLKDCSLIYYIEGWMIVHDPGQVDQIKEYGLWPNNPVNRINAVKIRHEIESFIQFGHDSEIDYTKMTWDCSQENLYVFGVSDLYDEYCEKIIKLEYDERDYPSYYYALTDSDRVFAFYDGGWDEAFYDILYHPDTANQVMTDLKRYDQDFIISNLDLLVKAGADIDFDYLAELAKDDPEEVAKNIDKFHFAMGERVLDILPKIGNYIIATNGVLEKLVKMDDIDFDIDEFASRFKIRSTGSEDECETISFVIADLVAAGAHLDINKLVREVSVYDLRENIKAYLNAGADPNVIAANLPVKAIIPPSKDNPLKYVGEFKLPFNYTIWDTAHADSGCYKILCNTGADMCHVISFMDHDEIIEYLDEIRASGEDMIDVLGGRQIAFNLKTLIDAGLDIDINKLASELPEEDLEEAAQEFLDVGVDIQLFLSRINDETKAAYADQIVAAGGNIDVDELYSALDEDTRYEYIDKLVTAGLDIDVNCLVDGLLPDTIARFADKFVKAGASIDFDAVTSHMSATDIVWYVNTLNRAGANINPEELVTFIDPSDLKRYATLLLAAGVPRDRLGIFPVDC